MAININPEAVLTFVLDNAELCEKVGVTAETLDDPHVFAKAIGLLRTAHGEPEKGEKAEREAVHYTVLLLNHSTGTFTTVGGGKGTVGRAPSDPAKWTELQRIESSARMKCLLLQKKGVLASVIKVPTSEL